MKPYNNQLSPFPSGVISEGHILATKSEDFVELWFTLQWHQFSYISMLLEIELLYIPWFPPNVLLHSVITDWILLRARHSQESVFVCGSLTHGHYLKTRRTPWGGTHTGQHHYTSGRTGRRGGRTRWVCILPRCSHDLKCLSHLWKDTLAQQREYTEHFWTVHLKMVKTGSFMACVVCHN